MNVERVSVRSILTRTSGFLASVTSHSAQPYRGCSFGRSACGVGCYARHNRWITQGRPWGEFLDARVDADQSYRTRVARERAWARRARGEFSIFLSSSTDPFVPQERTLRVTHSLLLAMLDEPPDAIVVQTHTDRVLDELDTLRALAALCRLRVHLSIESDLDTLPGLPPPAASVDRRFAAASALKAAGLRVVVTVSPLWPIADPDAFFARIAACADAVVLDHFVEGDGSRDGARTQSTALPAAIAAVDPGANALAYRDRMAAIARRHLPDRVGVNIDGFAGRFGGP